MRRSYFGGPRNSSTNIIVVRAVIGESRRIISSVISLMIKTPTEPNNTISLPVPGRVKCTNCPAGLLGLSGQSAFAVRNPIVSTPARGMRWADFVKIGCFLWPSLIIPSPSIGSVRAAATQAAAFGPSSSLVSACINVKPKHANTALPACARWRALFVTVLPLFMRNWRLSPEANGSALDPVMTQPELLLG